jgi:hypothetical protein
MFLRLQRSPIKQINTCYKPVFFNRVLHQEINSDKLTCRLNENRSCKCKLLSFPLPFWSQDSAVCIETAYGLDDRGVGVRVPVWSRIFSSPLRPDRLWDPPSLVSSGYWGLLLRGVKRPRHETDHSPPTCAEVRKT